jgi:hypothetical protein
MLRLPRSTSRERGRRCCYTCLVRRPSVGRASPCVPMPGPAHPSRDAAWHGSGLVRHPCGSPVAGNGAVVLCGSPLVLRRGGPPVGGEARASLLRSRCPADRRPTPVGVLRDKPGCCDRRGHRSYLTDHSLSCEGAHACLVRSVQLMLLASVGSRGCRIRSLARGGVVGRDAPRAAGSAVVRPSGLLPLAGRSRPRYRRGPAAQLSPASSPIRPSRTLLALLRGSCDI